MTPSSWAELLEASRRPRPLLRTVGTAVSVFVVVAVGIYLALAVSDLKEADDGNTDRLINRGELRLEKSVDEHTRTQTLICFAHPETRRENPTFDQMCKSIVDRWGVVDRSSTLGGG